MSGPSFSAKGRTDLGAFRQYEGVFYVDTEVAHRVLDLGVAQQDLHRPQITGRFVNDRCFGSAQRMGAVFLASQADAGDLLIDQSCVLPGAEVAGMVDAAGLQNSGVLLYQGLLPGISNVTLRVRYYGLYCWASETYAHEVGNTDAAD